MEYYTYAYLDPRKPGKYVYGQFQFEYEPFYVGKGKNNRKMQHLTESKLKAGDSNPKIAKIKKLRSLGFSPIIIEIDHFESEQQAYDAETDLIESIGSDFITEVKDGPLTNILYGSIINGASPTKGKTYLEIYGSLEKAEEQRKKRHEKQLSVGGFFKGGKHSEESKKKMGERSRKSQANGGHRKGIPQSKEYKIIRKHQLNSSLQSNTKIYKIKFNDVVYTTAKIKRFCEYMNISLSTLKIFYEKNIECKSGKTKGWKIIQTRYVDKESDSKYAFCIFTKEKG
jgi:hypothetical protein